MKALEVSHLNKSFGKRKVIDNLSFDVEEGEFVAIIGPSGSGKTTVSNMVGLLETTDSGRIKIFGQALPRINSRHATLLRRNEINYLFQSFALVSEISVKDNLLMGMNFVKKSKADKLKMIKQVLRDLDIAYLEDAMVNTLSGGEQQRVSLARAILKPGHLVLADEPTGALDPQHAEVAFQEIKRLQTEYGKTIIMVTHNIKEARQADRVIELKNQLAVN